MCIKSERTVSNTLTVLYDRTLFLLEPSDITANLAHKRVTVCDYPDGRLTITWRGVALPYRTFDKLQQVDRAKVVENKRLDATLAWIAEQQAERAAHSQTARSTRTPRRRGQSDHRFAVPSPDPNPSTSSKAKRARPRPDGGERAPASP